MQPLRKYLKVLLIPAIALAVPVELRCGPVDFGLAEFRAAMEARKISLRVRTEITLEAPETFRIESTRITGGDLRGLMYGLLEAAEQIRGTGRLKPARGTPATPIRGIRIFLHNQDLESDWYYSEEYWKRWFQMLARNRFNRFNLVFAHQTPYLAPPYPFWLRVPGHREIYVAGLSEAGQDRNLRMLRVISQMAADYAIDFTLGIWEHNIITGMKPSVTGLSRENIGPYSYAALKQVLAAAPLIRSVQVRTNFESGIPPSDQVPFFRDWIFRALKEAGRRVTLDLRGWLMHPDMLEAAKNSGVPLRLSSKYWAEHLGRPYQPMETWPGYSYLHFLRNSRPYEFYWEVWALGSHRILLWGDPDYVRRMVPTFTMSGTQGFEIDPPLAQKGFGNRPGKWNICASCGPYEFERYWFFYWLWGRLSYAPGTPLPKVENLEELRAASSILNEIVAAHLADPNMYIWPEVNPGGLIDAYKDVPPSDFRFIASIPEAVDNRIRRQASAKQTALETAAILEAASSRLAKTGVTDFQVLAHLARYHARKQRAAYHLELFYRTSQQAALDTARSEARGALEIWESLVKITDGVYPDQMALGPDDVGHWKDRLAYVRHDVESLDERAAILARFGAFQSGFDFGGRVEEPRRLSYRRDPFVLRNTVEPRFQAVDPNTKFTEELGYGWVTDGPREANALPLTPYAEVRATKPNPQQLPKNALFGDSIRGRGPQVFRVRTGDGEFTVRLLRPDGSEETRRLTAVNGHLDITLSGEEWSYSGVVIGEKTLDPVPPPRKNLARPAIEHRAPDEAVAGQPLRLTIRATGRDVTAIRLHYRPLNALEKFRTLESSGASATFTIPGGDFPADYDLLYYFEILNRELGGWFHPDPRVATPYFIVRVANP